MTKICMIMAIGPNNVIGKGKELAWHSKNDFYHFVQQTKGWPCIFGATTFYNLPKYPLKNRLNIVLDIESEGTGIVKNEKGSWIVTNSIYDALELVKNYDKIFICGGKSIYTYCLEHNLIDEIYLTKISDPTYKFEEEIQKHSQDFVYFPIDLDSYTKNWEKEVIEYNQGLVPENYACTFLKFIKKS